MNCRFGLRILVFAVLFVAIAISIAGQPFTVIHSFTSEGGTPVAGLTLGPDGRLYGVSAGGGIWGQGSVFVLDPDGAGGFSIVTLYSFTGDLDGASPISALCLASDGNFYGTTLYGVGAQGGTAFRVDTAGNLTTLHAFFGFADGYNPSGSLVQAADGRLYGVTTAGGIGYGTLFRMDLAGDVTILHSFEAGAGGAQPMGALVEGPDGGLYGTTSSGGPLPGMGTIYRIALDGTFGTLHNFVGSDGSFPAAGMVLGPDGYLWGTTKVGGNGQGTVFRSDLSGAVTAYPFSSADGYPVAPLAAADDGNLYGTTPFTVYRVATDGTMTTLHVFSAGGVDLFNLQAPVLQAPDGKLYGTASQAGPPTIFGGAFRIATNGTEYETLGTFAPGSARNPVYAFLQGTDGRFYGTGIGSYDSGSVFRVDVSGDSTTLHIFDGLDGKFPNGLVRTPGGRIFGSAAFGGSANQGIVFELDDAGVLTPFHDFVGSEGTAPQGLTLASDGTLWGAVSNPPAIYRLGPAGEFFFVAAVEGDGPYGELAEAVDGSFVGATLAGGTTTLGTLFHVDAAGNFQTLHTFSGWDGAYPSGRPILAPDGNFYGLTVSGGSQNFGTMYRMSPSGRVTTIHTFSAVDGLSPITGLTLGEDGYLYGTTRFGGDHALGNVFRADASGNVLSLYSFSGSDGREPLSQLIQATDGGLYGATNLGGLFGGGVVFRVEPPSALSVWTATPSSGPAAGGTPVTVTGFHFSHPSVTIGGATATDVVWTDPSTLTATTPALPPGTLNDIVVTNFDTRTGSLADAWFADFIDVQQGDPFHDAVETVFRSGITAGCSSGAYCRNDAVPRQQMAVFLLKGKHGAGYVPPACTGLFADVPCPGPFTDWIEQLSNEGITGGCGGGNFCPNNPVTRAQMAVFLLKAEHGSIYAPPACAGVFSDVTCPSQFADWVEQLYAENITGGCQASPLLYCPDAQSTRGQMAVLLVKTFSLP